jgi:hypothetical protein
MEIKVINKSKQEKAEWGCVENLADTKRRSGGIRHTVKC